MSDNLPPEVTLEILGRLPVQSLVRYRSECKTWNSLIDNPSFVSTQLQTALSNTNSNLLLVKNDDYFLHFANDGFNEIKQLGFPFKGCSLCFEAVGSCNGLVCLQFTARLFFIFVIWNPSVKKYITLPEPRIICWTKNADLFIGFGFDSGRNDYKLLIVVGERDKTPTEAYLFSLNENSWKKVTAVFPKYAIAGEISSNIFVKGAVHWLGYRRRRQGVFRNTVFGYDISTEKFRVIALPESLRGLRPLNLSIMKHEESSTIAVQVLKKDRENGQWLEIWVMREYGVVESWTKVLHLTGSGRLPKVLGFMKNGEVLLQADEYDGEMTSLDLNSQRMRHLGIESDYSFVDTCVESLVLIDKGVDSGIVNCVNHSSDSDSSE